MKKFEQEQLDIYLQSKNRDELVQLIKELVGHFEEVQEYFDALLTKDDRPFLKKAKEDIIKALYPNERGQGGLNIKAIDKVIRSFEFLTPKLDSVVQLRLFAVEEASSMVENYNSDFGEDFFVYFEDLFENLLQLLLREEQLGVYEHRIKNAIANTTDTYGHYDTLMDIYQEFYP